jgi:hypothetical protein
MATYDELKQLAIEADKRGDRETAIAAMVKMQTMQQPVDIKGAADKAQADVVEDMGIGGRLLAGVGQGVSDLGYGAGQALGLVSQDEVRAKRDRDAPLMATTAGKVGSVGGQIATALPAAFIPGVNTATGAAILGAVQGAAMPVAEGNVLRQKLTGAAVGAAVGRGTHALGNYVGTKVAQKTAARATEKLQNSGRDAVLAQGQKLGYAVEPTLANPSMTNRALEGIAGKLTTAQAVAEKNQAITNQIAKRAIGIADDSPLDDAALDQVRQQAGQIYQQIRTLPGRVDTDASYQSALQNIAKPFRQLAADVPEEAGDQIENLVTQYSKGSFDPSNVITLIQRRRKEASTLFKAFDDPVKRDMAKAHRAVADALEDLLERHVSKAGSPEMVQELRQARELIAKTYSIEAALNPGSGNVVARQLGNQLGKGKPLSGELLDVAKFAKTFPKSVQEVTSSMPGTSPLDWYAGAGVSVATGNPAGLAAVAGRPIARSLITSAPYQRAMVTPNYGPTIAQRAIPRIIQNRAAPAIASALSVNAVE